MSLNELLLIKLYIASAKKGTEKLSLMSQKSDAKFEEEFTCRFKSDMQSLTNFDPSTQKSRKFAL